MSTAKNLGGVDLSAATAANVFTGSANGNAFSVSICNRGSVSASVRLGFSSSSATFESANYLEYDTIVPANSVLERTGLVIEDNSTYLVVQSDVSSVNATAYGLEY